MRIWLALLLALAVALPARAQTQRTIAVTIDDLPYATAGQGCTPKEAQRFTRDFLNMLKGERVPAVGFAIPGRGCGGQAADPKLLDAWLDAGFELGSHTNTHPDINVVGAQAYVGDIDAAAEVLRPMLERRGLRLRWFRHPYLRTGAEHAIRDGLILFLAARGYEVAPVTFDNSEWVYAAAYARALKKGDAAEAKRIGEDYVRHMEEIAAFFEERSVAILGTEPPQILLIHANQLNRDWFPAVKAMLKRRGYCFETLDRAMADPAYRHADTYVGRWGMSWILRWGVTDGVKLVREPDPPQWVMELYEASTRPLPGPGAAPGATSR